MALAPYASTNQQQHNMPLLPSLHRSYYLLIAILLLALSIIAPVHSQQHDGGAWGEIKRATDKIITPVGAAARKRYEKLSDRGKFVAGAAVGFGASRFAVGSKYLFCAYLMLSILCLCTVAR